MFKITKFKLEKAFMMSSKIDNKKKKAAIANDVIYFMELLEFQGVDQDVFIEILDGVFHMGGCLDKHKKPKVETKNNKKDN